MPLVDPTALKTAANADPEFRMAARYWHAKLALASPSDVLSVEITDGRIATCGTAVADGPATITVTASDDGWTKFLARVPGPFYQDLLGGCVQHHGFVVAGDMLVLNAYYHAIQRLFAVMRMLRAGG